jgi:hypothetical protein
MDDLHRRALIRGVAPFAGVAVIGSILVSALGGSDSEATSSPTPTSSTAIVGRASGTAGMAHLGAGRAAPSYGDLVSTVPTRGLDHGVRRSLG